MESEKPVVAQNLTSEEQVIGQKLFFEGVHYEELKGRATVVGTHLSFMLHGGGEMASIHFREGLEKLNDYLDRPVAMMKMFLGNIRKDLRTFAQMLETDVRLTGVKEIWGLCSLPARWGERHGFKTKTWSNNRESVKMFDRSIQGRPDTGIYAIEQPLSLFFHERDTFRAEFLQKK